ncbi:MAG: hypothetical protein HW385_906 [candidate division NC10 bacterium]|nr:hypothetical protein [candidate division NC10 bacterium]
MTIKGALVCLLWCDAGSGDLKPLRAEVFVPASRTTGGIAEPRPVLEAEAATLAGRRMGRDTACRVPTKACRVLPRRRERAICSRSLMMTFLETTKFLASSSSVHCRSRSITMISCRLVSSIGVFPLTLIRRKVSGRWPLLRSHVRLSPGATTRDGTRRAMRRHGVRGGRRSRSR